MKREILIYGATFVLICDSDFRIERNWGILFSDVILDSAPFDELVSANPNVRAKFFDNSILLPSFSNPHVHFEWSKNTCSLVYGNFGIWIDSIMKERAYLLEDCNFYIKQAIAEQMQSGISAVGAISSHSYDAEILSKSGLKVVLFNEILGGREENLDEVFLEFKSRVEFTKSLENARFRSAIAIHAPYSVHSDLAKRVLESYKYELVSTHFLESPEEALFLDSNTGYFARFHERYLDSKTSKSFYTRESFLELFKDRHTIYAHCLQANERDFCDMSQKGFCIPCPRSNKLLINEMIDEIPRGIDITRLGIGTDGKSSNNNLNFLDELRFALFGSKSHPLEKAIELVFRATNTNAKALDLESGNLECGKSADFCIFELDDSLKGAKADQVPLLLLLQARKAKRLIIDGEVV